MRLEVLPSSMIKISVSHSLSWIHELSAAKLSSIFFVFGLVQVSIVDILDVYWVIC